MRKPLECMARPNGLKPPAYSRPICSPSFGPFCLLPTIFLALRFCLLLFPFYF